jgi:hypothetical protein
VDDDDLPTTMTRCYWSVDEELFQRLHFFLSGDELAH